MAMSRSGSASGVDWSAMLATATAALGYTAKLAWDMLRHNGPSALLLRSAVAAAL